MWNVKRRSSLAVLAAALASALAAATVLAQDRGGPPPRGPGGPGGPLVAIEPVEAPGIQWFATWETGKAEAARTGRPILLVAAAPRCHEVPGIW